MEYVDLTQDRAQFAAVVQQKVLTSTRLGAATAVSMKVMAAPDMTQRAADNLRLQLEAYCQTDHLVTEHKTIDFDEGVVVTRPARWWDALKFEMANANGLWRWINRRWPPVQVDEEHRLTQRVVVTFEAKHLYPQSSVLPEDFGSPILVESYSTDRSSVRPSRKRGRV
jgi:hypothetical protein